MKRIVALLALAGCAAPAAAPPPPADPTQDIRIEAASEEWACILREISRGRPLVEQERLAVSEKHYALALAYYDRSDFERAKVEAQKAVQAWPENLAARKLLAEVLSLIGGSPQRPTPPEHEVQVARVRVSGAGVEIEGHVRDGERFLNARMYAQALREFENAESKIRHLPWNVETLNDLLPRVREQIIRSRSGLDQAAKAREDMARKAAESDAARR